MARKAATTFTTDRLTIRPISTRDAAGLHECYGDPDAMRFWDSRPSHDVAETRRWIPRSTPHFAMWAVLTKEGKRFIGMVNFHRRHAGHRRLAIGYILSRKHWRRGYMHEALVPFIGHCFHALGSHRIEAEIEPENAASRALAEKLGFRAEGILRDRLCVEGKFRTIVLYALLADEWSARHPAEKAPRAAKAKR